jgi:glycosyltransferase involved in cell wall biosynthesis
VRVLLAMLGARRHYLVPEVMAELGILGCFVTDVFVARHGWLQKALAVVGRKLRMQSLRALAGRSSSRIPTERIVALHGLGLRYALARRLRRSGDARLFAAVNRRFCLRAASHLGAADVCWAYNGAALELFEAARARDIGCVLEQVIAPRRDELRELARARQDWPQWAGADDLQSAASDPLAAREQAEWRLADIVVAGSRYVQDCLERSAVPKSRCIVVPSAVDLDRFRVGTDVRSGGPLRVLFVGQINLRKGAPYLLDAVRRLNSPHIRLKLIGAVQAPQHCVRAFAPWAEFGGPVPPAEITAHYQWADIVVVPSVCEGSAMVSYEARGCGVPIVATPNAGAWFAPGIDGLEIPVRDVEAIARILDRMARDRGQVRELREGAIANRRALGREVYRDRIRQVLEVVGTRPPRDLKMPA